MHETFWTLLGDPAHWLFELFLMLLFDGLIFGLAWPFIRKHWHHHLDHDVRDQLMDWARSKAEPPHRANEGWSPSIPLQDGTLVDGCRYHSSPEPEITQKFSEDVKGQLYGSRE
jgi:hypothetical protein